MSFLTIIVLCFFFLQTFGRPAHVLQDYDKDSKENLYSDGDSGDADDYLHNEEKSSIKQFTGNEPHTKADFLKEHGSNSNEDLYREHSANDYLENSDEGQPDSAHLSHRDTGNAMKGTPARTSGIMLFHEDEKFPKVAHNDYNSGTSERARYFKRDSIILNLDRDGVNRGKRQIKNNYLSEPKGTDEISTHKNNLITNEDEETAIRRHIKKLSKEELDELFHSLSEDKQLLLKNIIDSSHEESDNINKREITKKAGTNEENSFVGNDQSAIHGVSANLEVDSSMAPDLDKEDNAKKADIESMPTQSPEITSNSDKSNDNVNALDSIEDKKLMKGDGIEKLKCSQTEAVILSNSDTDHEVSKKENKREINSINQSESHDKPNNSESSNKEDLYCPGNGDLSPLWNDETNLYNDNKYKREVCSDDSDLITSLEESFPSVDNMNSIESGLDMAPLIRVKRNNPVKTEKRDVNLSSNLKVPYFSSALENNEDSDEGNEFQEDTYFDRGAKFANSGELAAQKIDNSRDIMENDLKFSDKSLHKHTSNNKIKTGSASLGSDTDVVLSGIEGVDDNMMYNSVERIRRTGNSFDNSNIEDENSNIKQDNIQEFESQGQDNVMSEYNNEPRYQENDAFGSLPRNYEQDLGRFKRIRRLKAESGIPNIEH